MADKFDPPKPDTSQYERLKDAWRALEDGAADRQQASLIIQHLAGLTGYYNGRSLTAWQRDTGSTEGYEMACIEHQAKRWVFSEILVFLTAHPDGRGGPTDQ